MTNITLEEAWAAGFIDGEGSIVISGKSSFRIQVPQANPESLYRLQAVMPWGKVRGPLTRSSNALSSKPYWVFTANGKPSVIYLEKVWSLLTEATKNKVFKAYRRCLETHETLPRHVYSDMIYRDMEAR